MADQMLENEDAVLIPEDGAREANIGEVAKMPTLLEALHSWEKLIAAEKPTDQPTPFKKLHMVPDGRISRGNGPLRMTYRVFGGLLRDYCAPPKNVARCLHRLTAGDPGDAAARVHTPRSFAYNDYLGRGAAAHGEKEVWLRTRDLPGLDGQRRKVIVGQVTPTHSRAGSDDPVFIEKLRKAFSQAELKAIRAHSFRGIEVSELRAVIPSLRVEMAPGEWWSGYFIVRNSEVGAASWMVGAGLAKEMDEQTLDAARRLGFEGTASLSVQANTKIGVHTGKKVAERVEEALTEARALLDTLVEQARNLAEQTSKLTVEQIVEKLAKGLKAVGGSEDVQDRLLGGLAMQGAEWARLDLGGIPIHGPVLTNDVVSFLGQAMRIVKNRAQSYPLERLAGRVLLHGIDVALKNVEAVSDVEEDE